MPMQSFRWDHSRQVLNLNQPPVCCDLRSQSESVLECFVKGRFGPGHKREQETVSLVLLGRRFVGASFCWGVVLLGRRSGGRVDSKGSRETSLTAFPFSNHGFF